MAHVKNQEVSLNWQKEIERKFQPPQAQTVTLKKNLKNKIRNILKGKKWKWEEPKIQNKNVST